MNSNPVVDNNGHVNDLVQKLDEPRCPPASRDIDHEEVLKLRNLRSFLPSKPRQLSLHNDEHGNDSVHARRRNCESATVSSTIAPNTAGPANPTSITLSMYCN